MGYRIAVVEELAPLAMDEVNAAAGARKWCRHDRRWNHRLSCRHEYDALVASNAIEHANERDGVSAKDLPRGFVTFFVE